MFGKRKAMKRCENGKNARQYTRKKIEVQSQEHDYHMYEELVIFPAFVTLKIFDTQGKYIYHQMKFYHHFLRQNTFKSSKEQLLGNFFCIFTEFHMFNIHKKSIHHQLSYYHFLQQTTIEVSCLKNCFWVVFKIFIMCKIYIHHQISEYLFLQ